jgi:hypothetical protein
MQARGTNGRVTTTCHSKEADESSIGSGGELDRGADGQPPDASADVLRRARKLAFDRIPSLPEMPPALVVDGDRDTRPDEAAQLDGVLCGHGVADRPSDGELHASQVQDGYVDL